MKSVAAFDGFSIMELLVVLVIIACLTRLAAPAMHAMVVRVELDAVTHKLFGALHVTRLLAVVEHRPLALCGSSDLTSIDGQWSVGWVVIDPASAEIKYRYKINTGNIAIAWRGGFASSECIRFDYQGFTMGHQGTFTLSVNAAEHQRRLIVSRAGRVRMA